MCSQKGMTIAELIRKFLQEHPEGVGANDTHAYCIRHDAPFKNGNDSKQRKSVSGQLSKMKKRGIVSLADGRWFILSFCMIFTILLIGCDQGYSTMKTTVNITSLKATTPKVTVKSAAPSVTITSGNNAGSSSSSSSLMYKVWQYCNDRWAYYDRLAGRDTGDLYTERVFRDAGVEFGISPMQAELYWDEYDKRSMGIGQKYIDAEAERIRKKWK